MAINLHAIVNPVIAGLHPNYNGTIYRSDGQAANERGQLVPIYAEGEVIMMQLQSQSSDELYHADRVNMNDVIRHAYLYSASSTGSKPASLIRPFARNGDMIQHEDGTWWLVKELQEDFNKAGWVNVSIQLQVKAPDFSASPWWEG